MELSVGNELRTDEGGKDNVAVERAPAINRPRESLKGALEARVRPQKKEILE